MKQLSISKKRVISFLLILATILTMIPLTNFSVANAASIYDTGTQAIAMHDITVYTTSACTTKKGTIFFKEGFTVLYNVTSNCDYVEYSTSSGTKDGYITHASTNSTYYGMASCIGKIKVTSTVYYGNNTSTYQKVGTVYANELVTVMGRSSGWVYIEYNSTVGRKRGYIPESNITLYENDSYIPEIPIDGYYLGSRYISGSYTVYAGQTNQYPVVGSISNETVRILSYFDEELTSYQPVTEIEYTVNGTSQKKTGYIIGYRY